MCAQESSVDLKADLPDSHVSYVLCNSQVTDVVSTFLSPACWRLAHDDTCMTKSYLTLFSVYF